MKFRTLILLTALMSLTACSEYWWTRGQAPGVSQLMKRADQRLDTAINENPYQRDKFIIAAKEVSDALSATHQAAASGNGKASVMKSLEKSMDNFAQLEGQLSVTSRPPYGELSGQLRVFASTLEKEGKIDPAAFGLFTARAKVFLASELSVPAPSFGA